MLYGAYGSTGRLHEPRLDALTPVQAFGADFALVVTGTRIQEL
jgi:hypothetical protein